MITAWRVERKGSAVLRHDVERPSVGAPGARGADVVVEVEAAAVNFADGLVIDGWYQERPSLPFTPGFELAGTIVSGSGGGFRRGERVVGLALPGVGSWAQFAGCDHRQLVRIPASVPVTDAVALHVNAQTAWFALHRRGGVRPGDTVLVHAAAGGVGAMAVQLAVAAGAVVIGTCSASKQERVLALGARAAYDNRASDWATRVRTEHGAVDIVVDPVGGDVFAPSWRLLGFEARYVVVGFASGAIPTLEANRALVKNATLHGLYWTPYTAKDAGAVAESAESIFALHADGRLDPCVSVVANMRDALDRVRDVGAGLTTGKTVLTWDAP
jgi:NADPH2:quinone reductase